MKEYLSSFFKEFDYTPQSTARLLEAYAAICACEDARALFEQALAAYPADLHCDWDGMMAMARRAGRRVGLHDYTAELLLFICLSKPLRQLYLQNGTAISVWHDSMLDLKYKLDECLAVNGICGTFVGGWFPGFFNLTRFAMGRLQFELIDLDRDRLHGDILLRKGDKVINVHIPRSGQPLSPALYEDAFARAKAFFAQQIPPEQCPDGKVPFACHSWLLYPEQASFLPERSNVRKFLSEFAILEWDYNNGEDLWRLFDTMERHPDRLPADSSLRRAYVRHLQDGGRVGWGLGLLFR